MTGTQDSDYREQIAEVLHAAAVDVPGTPQVGPALIERQIAALWPRVSPLVEQLRQARAAYNRMAGHAVDRAAERDRYYLAWQSAARGRRQVRIERDTLGECMACVWCDDTGIAPEERFGRDDDGAPMMDGDQPCPKGCPVRRDIAYLLSEEKEAEQLRAALVLATAEAEDARDGGLDLAQELAEVRESRDQYHKNWDAAVAANMTALDTIGGLRADLETRTCERDYARAELDAVGRAIEGYLGVEYGTPVESARVLVERCVDAERALDGIRAERDEWWRHFLGRQRGYSDALRGMARRATALRRDRDQVHNQFLDHYNVASVQLDRVLELEEGLRERTDQRDKAVQDARGERHVRRLNELALLGQLSAERESRFRWAEEAAEHEQGEREMANHVSALDDECADLRARLARAEEFYTDVRDLQVAAAVRGQTYHAQAQKAEGVERVARLNQGYEAFDFNVLLKQVLLRWADVAPVELTDDEAREALEDARGVATQPAESETPDEHVREHDDAAPTRDAVVVEFAATWDGVDRTPDWVRVVEPCPVPDCTIPQVHGHEGYGLRFTPVAQPAHPRPPLDPPPNSLNERLHIRRSGAPGTGQWGARWPGSAWVTNLGEAQARIEVERHAKAGAVLVWRESKDHDWAEVASPGTGTEAGE